MENIFLQANDSPNFERLRTTLMGGQADRVPVFELGIDPVIMAKLLGRPISNAQDLVDFALLAGYDYVKCAPLIDMDPAGKATRNGLVTHATDLDRARNWAPEGHGLITSLADLEAFPWPKPDLVSYEVFERMQKVLPPEMKIVGQYGDIFTYVWEFMGFEAFSYALIDNQDLIEAMFAKIGSIELALFRNMLKFERVGALFYSDDIGYFSGLMCAPSVFRQYLFPWMVQIADLCRGANIPFIYHSDGRLWEVMDDLVELGVNALHPIEPKAFDIRAVKKRYGDRLCLIGNVDVDLLARGTPEQVRQTVRALIQDVGVNGGYCVGSGNSVPQYVRPENYQAMLNAVREFGRY